LLLGSGEQDVRKLLIGPALTGVCYLAGSYYGADAEQLIHKSPEATYQGVNEWLDNIGSSGTTSFEGGKPTPYEIQVDRTSGQHLIVHVLFDGKEGASTDLDFVSQDNGKSTLVKARAHGDTAVLSSALSGTAMARMAYAPDWMLNMFTLRPLLQKVGDQIQQGEPASYDGQSAGQEPVLNAEQQSQRQQWQQYSATQPSVDPNADADRYLNGGNAAN
jgi:hypothetical protein